MDSHHPFCVPSLGIYHGVFGFYEHTPSLPGWAQHIYANLLVLGPRDTIVLALVRPAVGPVGRGTLKEDCRFHLASGLLFWAPLGLMRSGLQTWLRALLIMSSLSLAFQFLHL